MELPTKTGRIQLNEVHYDIVCTKFVGKVFLVITEIQKIGTILEVVSDAPIGLGYSRLSFSVRTLLGKDDDITHTVGRAIAGHITSQTHNSIQLVLALGFKQSISPSSISSLLSQLDSFNVWSEISL